MVSEVGTTADSSRGSRSLATMKPNDVCFDQVDQVSDLLVIRGRCDPFQPLI